MLLKYVKQKMSGFLRATEIPILDSAIPFLVSLVPGLLRCASTFNLRIISEDEDEDDDENDYDCQRPAPLNLQPRHRMSG